MVERFKGKKSRRHTRENSTRSLFPSSLQASPVRSRSIICVPWCKLVLFHMLFSPFPFHRIDELWRMNKVLLLEKQPFCWKAKNKTETKENRRSIHHVACRAGKFFIRRDVVALRRYTRRGARRQSYLCSRTYVARIYALELGVCGELYDWSKLISSKTRGKERAILLRGTYLLRLLRVRFGWLSALTLKDVRLVRLKRTRDCKWNPSTLPLCNDADV